MAPEQVSSPEVELHQSSVTKPSPLRIIKRSQTVSGRSAPKEVIRRHSRGISESSYESKGSPPAGPDRPLTIHKLRKDRGSVLDGLEDGAFKEKPDNIIQELVHRHRGHNFHRNSLGDMNTVTASSNNDDPDVTPKAKQDFSRTFSAGGFSKPEYNQAKTDGVASTHPARAILASDNSISPFNRVDGKKELGDSPRIRRRRPSKSKNFFLKAIGGRSAVESELNHKFPTASRGTLRRRLSRHDRKISSSSYAESITSVPLSHGSLESESRDITDVHTDPRMSNYDTRDFSIASSLSNTTPSTETLVLCPCLTITSEASSIDSAGCSMWAAVSVTGVLREPHHNAPHMYGGLYALRFDFQPGPGCMVEEIFGDLYEPRRIQAANTELILVKVRLPTVKVRSRHIKESSDELMAELQNHLGETMTPYLTARITYRHSAFPGPEDSVPSFEDEISCTVCQTRMQTETRAVIKRNNIYSAWSPRTSRTIKPPLHVNPLVQLIETHLPHDQAREAIRLLASERVQIPQAKRHDGKHGQETSSAETVRANGIAATIDSAVNMLMAVSQDDRPTTPASLNMLEVIDSAAEAEMDPARKIWSHMRNISRPSHEKHVGLDADTPNSSDEEDEAAYSSASYSAASENGRMLVEESDISDQFEEERSRIKEFVVRSERGAGADTLRGTVARKKGPAKGSESGVGALGLTLGGRSWGWSPPWW
ncbi:hypothetical protein BP5796_01237 [Coleophoma crateriformis]|uniref:Uncharacterized protein n=1 Tax=Coleophoma crateriformis TaxID=565419 RepID=A0A3D8SZU0_9HELO|nr:hypothetical protein BP5796_01237 [Coleophoma crateriformis]